MTSKSSHHSRLLALAQQCAAGLNTQRITVATHVDDFLAAHNLLTPDEAGLAMTLREIVYGLVRHKKLLQITLDGFFAKSASQVSRSDRPMYEIILLLVVFKLQELGLAEFRRFVLSQEPYKMHCLLTFLFTPEMQDGWLKEQWSTVYDHVHVETKLLGDLRAVAPQMQALLSELAAMIAHNSAAATGAATAQELHRLPRKESTVPEPFALTQPKVKMLPTPPIQMDAVYKATPLPAPTPSLQQLEAEALARRRANEEATYAKHAAAAAPQLATDARAATTHTASEKLRLELEQREREANQGLKITTTPPVFKEVAPARGTVATILREDLLYRKRQEERRAALAKFESELRDEEAFDAWRRKMEAEDEERAAAEIQARKEAAKASALEAIKAMAVAAEEKHKQVLEIREELLQKNIEKELELEKDLSQKKSQVAAITSGKAAIPLAVKQVQEVKKSQAETIASLKAAGEKQKKRDAARDLAAKKQLIREIQAMEKLAAVRAKRPKEIDPTKSAGLGLLEEMSLVELEARLKHLAEAEAVYVAEKRERILAEKAKKTQVLAEMQRNAARMRKDTAATYAAEKSQRISARIATETAAKEKLATEHEILQEHLAQAAEAKRIEALRLASELKAKKIQNEFYARTKQAAAEERAADLARAGERIASQKASIAADAEARRVAALHSLEGNRAIVKVARAREVEAHRRAADALLAEHRADGVELAADEATLVALNRREIRAAVADQIDVRRNANPYAKKIAEREARRATSLTRRATSSANATKKSARLSATTNVADEFAASQVMAERELRAQIASLSVADGEPAEAEEKQQPFSSPPPISIATATDPLAATTSRLDAALALSNRTLQRVNGATATTSKAKPATKAKAATTKQVPLAARA